MGLILISLYRIWEKEFTEIAKRTSYVRNWQN